MSRYHLTVDGPKPCSAKIKCPLQAEADKNDLIVEHFSNKKEALEAYSVNLEKMDNGKHFDGFSKKNNFSFSSSIPKFKLFEQKKMVEEMIDEHNSLKEKCTREEFSSLNLYSYLAYKDINSFLRLGEDKFRENYSNGAVGKIDEDLMKKNLNSKLFHTMRHIINLDTLFQKAGKSNKDRELYRFQFIDTDDMGSYVEDNFKIGQTFMDKGFVSTSQDPGFIAAHIGDNNNRNKANQVSGDYVVFRILSKNGISLQRNMFGSNVSVQTVECERLLPRNSKFKVVGVSEKKLGYDSSREDLRYSYRGYRGKDQNVCVVDLVDVSDDENENI